MTSRIQIITGSDGRVISDNVNQFLRGRKDIEVVNIEFKFNSDITSSNEVFNQYAILLHYKVKE